MTIIEIRKAVSATIVLIVAVALSIPAAREAIRAVGQPLDCAIAKPLLILAAIVPAFLIGGWWQPRHPLVFGFIAGTSAMLLIDGHLHQPPLAPLPLLGETLSAGLTCSIAAFAGRQFKRLRASPGTPTGSGKSNLGSPP